MICYAHLALTDWVLGEHERSEKDADISVKLGQEDLAARTLARHFQALLFMLRRQHESAYAIAQDVRTTAESNRWGQWTACGYFVGGWALTQYVSAQAEDGLRQMLKGQHEWAARNILVQAHHRAVLAEVLLNRDRVAEAEAWLLPALDMAKASALPQEAWWNAEIHRVYGLILDRRSDDSWPEAQREFHSALQIATDQDALSLQLRSAMDLYECHRKRSSSSTVRERDCLNGIYQKFTDGLNLPELRRARALLEYDSKAGCSTVRPCARRTTACM